MKKNILVRTNILVCIVIVVGFLLTALLSYRANFSASLENIEQVSGLISEGIYHQMNTTFTRPLNISLTMANDSLLHDLLAQEPERLDDPAYAETMRNYLRTYRERYDYDSVFLVSAATARYYHFNGLDRVLERGDPENVWYFDELLGSETEYSMNVDNDQVAGAENAVTVFVNCKIRDNSGALLGVVGVGVRIDGLQRTLQDYRDQFGVNAYLIDGAGTIELSTDYSGYEQVNLFEMDTARAGTARQDILSWKEKGAALSFWSLNGAGQKRDYVVARYLPEIQWHLVVERETSGMMGKLSRQFLVTVLVIAVILGIILFIITNMIRRFNRQIVTLTKSMERERQAVFERATEQLFENIYEVDITRNRPANQTTAAYFESLGAPADCTYEQALHIIAEKQIQEEFRQGYLDTFSPESVLRAFEEGKNGLTYECMITRDGEQYYWMRITSRMIKWESSGNVHMLIYRQNVNAEKLQEQKLLTLAQTDEMTGLLTKMATHRKIDELLTNCRGKPAALLMIDIDDFKQANDQFGHDFGDSVICAFARLLQAQFCVNDVVGRIGGDEFAAFVQGAGRAWTAEKAERLSLALSFTHEHAGMSWHVSASIGVALAPRHGADAAALYRSADAALYQTKKRGKDGFTILDSPPRAREGAAPQV